VDYDGQKEGKMKKTSDKIFTLCFVRNDSQVLLARKKSRWGAGRLNGYGGKARAGKDIEAEAKRELKAESGLVALKMRKIGLVYFEFLDNEKVFNCHYYSVHIADCKGQPKETKEMGSPQWYKMDMNFIPHKQMWPGDINWLPYFIAGQDFHGWILYDNAEEKNVLNHKILPC
jgi:ADP-ribose pyrophosphatase YjhB (NUDIX family)